MAFGFHRWLIAAAAFIPALLTSSPASANFFWKAPNLAGAPITGMEPGIGVLLPDATAVEQRAWMVWNIRAGLNQAALQCQFDPTLLTLNQYNHMIDHHKKELGLAYTTIGNYFKRKSKTAKLGTLAFDSWDGKTYSSFSTVFAQYTFCETASKIGAAALFAKKGELYLVGQNYLREFRNSLQRHGEQQFRFWIPPYSATYPNLDDRCWDKKNAFIKRCLTKPPKPRT